MQKVIDTTPVFVTLTRTAIHTLNTYGDNDPVGQDIMCGLTAMAEMVHTVCPDSLELKNYYDAIKSVQAEQEPFVCPVTVEEMRNTHAVLRDFIQGLDPEDLELDKVTAALEYLKDFWETYNEGK